MAEHRFVRGDLHNVELRFGVQEPRPRARWPERRQFEEDWVDGHLLLFFLHACNSSNWWVTGRRLVTAPMTGWRDYAARPAAPSLMLM